MRIEQTCAGRNTWRVLGAIVLLGVAGAAPTGRAQEDIVVTKTGADKSAIDVTGIVTPPTRGGAAFTQTLADDLRRSGWFTPTGQGGAAIVARGTLRESGRTVTVLCELLNRTRGRAYFRENFSGDDPRRVAHQVADAIVRAVKGVDGIASSRIVMVGAHGTGKDVYVCDADGQNLVRITSQGSVCLSPNWWPDAKALVYTSFHKGFPDVYRIDLASNQRTRLAGFPGLNAGADISPDGGSMALALSKDGNPELYVMALRSRRLTRMTRWPRSSEASPSWSPDGRQIVFVSDRTGRPQLYILDRRGGGPKRISFGAREGVAPDWGPDGRIAYSRKRSGEPYQVCIYDPKTDQSTPLVIDGADYEDPAWAPDGRHLVCVRTLSYHSDLYLLDTLGDPPIRLTTWQGDWYSPAWSPR